MLASLGLILLCQLIGEVVVHGLGLPLPGPVLGLLLLLILLLAATAFRCSRAALAGTTALDREQGPPRASVAAVRAGRCRRRAEARSARLHGIAIVLVLALSVVVTLLATVLTFRLVSRVLKQQDARMNDNPFSLWVYLSAIAAAVADRDAAGLCGRRCGVAGDGRHPLANPVLHAMWIIGASCCDDRDVLPHLFRRRAIRALLLGPATVAHGSSALWSGQDGEAHSCHGGGAGGRLAHRHRVGGGCWRGPSGAAGTVVLSLAPKSVTAGVAMGITRDASAADPSLHGGAVMLDRDHWGAIIVTPLMNRTCVTKLPRPRLRGRACRHTASGRPGLPGRRHGRRLRRDRHGPRTPW